MFARRHPYWRWSLLEYAIKHNSPPSDPWLENLYDLYKGSRVGSGDQKILMNHIFSPFKRDAIMSYFFARCSTADIEASLELSPEVIEGVARLFFDRTQLQTKLDHFEYAREYVEEFASTEGRNLISLGMAGGPLALMNKFCLGYEMPNIDQEYVNHRMYMTAISFGLMARGNALTSKEGKEALKWFQQATDMGVMYRKMIESSNDTQDAVVAIEQRKLLHKPEAAGINRSEILH